MPLSDISFRALIVVSAVSFSPPYGNRFSTASQGSHPQLKTTSTSNDDPVLVGAGDLASCTSTNHEATARLLDDIPGTVFTAGDNAVVGTGGFSHYKVRRAAKGSEVRNTDTFGVLKLTLHERGYDWRFVPVRDHRFTDAGSGACH